MDEAGPRFDVFLSHNRKDKPAVIALAERLKAEGLNVWLDVWELRPGHPWQEALEEIIETTGAAAVLVGADGIGPWEDAEMRACLNEFTHRKLPVIPVLLPGCPERPSLPLLLRRFTWVDFRGGLEDEGFRRLVWGITGKKPADTPSPVRPEQPVPPPPKPARAGESGGKAPTAASPAGRRFLRRLSPWVLPTLAQLFTAGWALLWRWAGQDPEAAHTNSPSAAPHPIEPPFNVALGGGAEGPGGSAPLSANADALAEPEMVSIPGGKFWMGADKAPDPNAQSDEGPRHRVTVKPFRIGKYEITQGQ